MLLADASSGSSSSSNHKRIPSILGRMWWWIGILERSLWAGPVWGRDWLSKRWMLCLSRLMARRKVMDVHDLEWKRKWQNLACILGKSQSVIYLLLMLLLNLQFREKFFYSNSSHVSSLPWTSCQWRPQKWWGQWMQFQSTEGQSAQQGDSFPAPEYI